MYPPLPLGLEVEDEVSPVVPEILERELEVAPSFVPFVMVSLLVGVWGISPLFNPIVAFFTKSTA
jgi:hypothetical protein